MLGFRPGHPGHVVSIHSASYDKLLHSASEAGGMDDEPKSVSFSGDRGKNWCSRLNLASYSIYTVGCSQIFERIGGICQI